MNERHAGPPPGHRPIPALVGLAFAVVVEDVLLAAHAAGFTDLRRHHLLNVLRHLGPPGVGDRPADLARAAGITPQTMSSQLAELERAGYVRRQPDATDGRGVLIHWGRRGLEVGELIEDYYRDLESALARATSQADVAAARRVLSVLSLGGVR